VSPSEIIERICDDGEQLRPAVVLAVLPQRGTVFQRAKRDTFRPGAYLQLDRMNSKCQAGMIGLAFAFASGSPYRFRDESKQVPRAAHVLPEAIEHAPDN